MPDSNPPCCEEPNVVRGWLEEENAGCPCICHDHDDD